VTLPSLPERRRKEIASLVRKKYRERLGQFVVEGLRSVQAALDARAPLVELVVADTVQRDARVQALLAQAAVPAFVLPVRAFERLSAVQTSQGTLAVARATPFPAASLAGLQAVLVLDGVQDPGNVGTVMRTAAWFGVDALLAGPGTADYYNPKVVRAAMGGLWDLHLAGTDDLAGSLRRLQAAGFGLYGADLEGTEAAAWQPRRPSALVLGSEAHGLSPGVARVLDERIVIAGASRSLGAESLNVAVAAGILIYQWQRRLAGA
jgi:TrmH family RNA methyltransferase